MKVLYLAATLAAFAASTVGSFAQDAAISCGGLTIVSLEPSDVSSQIDGELTTFSFDITGTIENAGDKPATASAKLSSGDEVLESLDIADLAPGSKVTLSSEAKKWSPYTDHGFELAIAPSDGEPCKLAVDGSALEQSMRGQ